MNISYIKIGWKYLTSGSTGVLDYVLDVANNAVNKLEDSSKENIAKVLVYVRNILSVARSLAWLVPSKWMNAYSLTLVALADVVNACEDCKITSDELAQVMQSWAVVYSAWRAE